MNDGVNSTAFCSSSEAMIMYMDGFRFSLKGGQPCLNLLFPTWTLDTRAKFLLAMAGTILLSVGIEYMSKLRHALISSSKEIYKSPRSSQWILMLLRFAISGMHGAQALLGFIAMLVTMTFSVELLCCVVFGLSLGYWIFYKPADVLQEPAHVTSNPCCAFMEEEVKDLRRMETDEDLASTAPSTQIDETPLQENGSAGLRYRNPI